MTQNPRQIIQQLADLLEHWLKASEDNFAAWSRHQDIGTPEDDVRTRWQVDLEQGRTALAVARAFLDAPPASFAEFCQREAAEQRERILARRDPEET